MHSISLCLSCYSVVSFLRAAALLKLSHVRLDREQISEIDNLDCLGPVTNLYLQKVSHVVYLLNTLVISFFDQGVLSEAN